MKAQPPLLLVGPTACGKSEVALLLAERLGGEIVSVDSMQVYRGLDIGTAKPSAQERNRVPHHLIDVVGLEESFDAARFVALAEESVREIQSRGCLPILCGGTGLYFKAFLQGLGTAPPADAGLRATLEGTPLNELLAELAEKDRATYQVIDRQNLRRVIRAVEVLRLTGKPYSQQKADWNRIGDSETRNGPAIGIRRSREDLRRRIDTRVDEMFRRGLVHETSQLLAQGLDRNLTAMQALGYRQAVNHLRGQLSLDDTVSLVKTRTRQFAKRQMTWFERQLSTKWVAVEPGQSPASIANEVFAKYTCNLPSAPR